MKYIVFGLGAFGSSLAIKLTAFGNEVIGVDKDMAKIELIKDRISHAVQLNSTDITAVSNLPLKDTDIVVVAIGEDPGANIMTTALMKQLNVKRLISRTVNPLQEMVLDAMGVDEIISPEEETAARWSKKLNLGGVVDSFEINQDYSIIEATIPQEYNGKTLEEVGLRRKYNIIVLTTLKVSRKKNKIDAEKNIMEVQEVASAKTVLQNDDVMVLYGHNKDIKKLLKDHTDFIYE